jgi:vacuolar-type H+-ATPase subunit C/Vma6
MSAELVMGAGIGGISVIFGVIYFKYYPLMTFLYANACVQARSNRIFSGQKIETLAESKKITDFLNAIQETEYTGFIENQKSIREIHSSIERGFLEEVSDIKEISPKSMRPIMDAYISFWETKIIKTFYRQKYTEKAGAKKISKELVYPVGMISAEKIKELHETKTIADMGVVLANTPYSKAFENEYNALEEFEVAIDRIVFDGFVQAVKKAKIPNKKIISGVFNTKFDLMNLLVLLKCEARNIAEERRKKLLIKNDSELFYRAEKMIYSKNIEELVEHCKGLPYYPALLSALEEYKKDNSLSHFEKNLLKYYVKSVCSKELQYFQGPYPLITYLIKKETEQRNLLTISKGIDVGFTAQEIKELVI